MGCCTTGAADGAAAGATDTALQAAEPRNSIYNQFREIFRNEGVELSIDARVFEQISEIAIEYRTGARSLRGIFEEMITPILYAVPDRPEVGKVVIASLFTEPSFINNKEPA